MATNRFEQFTPNEHISTYVPLPVDFMAKALSAKQAEYDTALDQADAAEEAFKINAIDQHQQFKQQKQKEYNNKLTEIADYIVKTGDTSKAREIKSLANRWKNDPIVNELQTSYAQYGEYQKDRIKKGDKYGVWHDPTANFTGDLNGQINPFRYSGMGERQDHQKRAEDMMSNIKASSSEDYKIFDIDPNTGNITKVKQGQESIGRDRVLQLAKNKIGDFLSTTEGDDYIKELKYKFPNATPEQLQNEAIKYLYNAGSNQIFSKSTIDKDFNWGPSDMRESSETVPYYPSPITQVKGVNYDKSQFEILDSGSKIKYTDKEAKEITKGKVGKQLEAAYAQIAAGKGATKNITIKQPKDLTKKEQQYTLDFIKNIDPELYDRVNKGERIPLGELAPIYKQINKSFDILSKDVQVNSGVRGMTVNEQKNENRWLFGTSEKKTVGTLGNGLGVNAKYYIKGESKPFTYDELLAEFPEDATVEVTGKFSGANPYVRVTGDKSFANARQISINGKEVIVNGPQKMINKGTGRLSSENVELEVNNNVNEVYDARLTPRTPQTKNIWGEEYKIIYIPNETDETTGTYRAIRKGVEELQPASSAEELEQIIANREHQELLSKKK